MYRVLVTELAGKDLDAIVEYIAVQLSSPIAAGELLEHIGRLVNLDDAIMEINDMDTIFLDKDIRSHLGVPLAGKVTEVASVVEQFLECCSRHCFIFLFF